MNSIQVYQFRSSSIKTFLTAKLHVVLLLLACLLLTNALKAQTTGKTAVARIIEGQIRNSARIIVVYENGKEESIPMKDLYGLKTEEQFLDVMIENQKIIKRFLDDMNFRGYDLEEMSSTGATYFVSMLIFRKRNQ